MTEQKSKNESIRHIQDLIDQVIERAKKNPDELTAQVINIISQKGPDLLCHTINFLTYSGMFVRELTFIGAKVGLIDVQDYMKLVDLVPIFNNISNMGGTYAFMGITMYTVDFLKGALQGLGQDKIADKVEKVLPMLTAITLVGINVYVETRKILPTDTLDPWDAALGSIMVIPGYFIYRRFIDKNPLGRKFGFTIFGKLKREITKIDEPISLDDIEIIETVVTK